MSAVRATVLMLLGLLLSVGIAAALGVREYGTPGVTENGGITYGRCGIELWGIPGHFCDVD